MADGNATQNTAPLKESQKIEAPVGMPEGLTPSPDAQPVTPEMLTAYNQQKKTEADKKTQRAEKDISVLENITVG